MDNTQIRDIELHPFGDFVPPTARAVLMGTFPPQPHRWCMNFFYPNRTNDMWRVMGLIFMGDAEALYNAEERTFRVDLIQQLLTAHHIALASTAVSIRRLQGNAADKHLQVVEPVDLPALLARMPQCRAIGTTGLKAAEVIASVTDTPVPAIDAPLTLPNGVAVWRLPSTSRAYPAPLQRKADAYARFFRAAGVLD